MRLSELIVGGFFVTYSLSTLVHAGLPALNIPPEEERIQPTRAGGSRGCGQDLHADLILVKPGETIGKTIESHPTFFWEISENISVPVLFTLAEVDGQVALFSKRLTGNKGINTLTLPTEIELVPGKTYQWMIEIICNELKPSENLADRGWIQRIPITPDLQTRLEAAQSNLERAQTYTKFTLWYDSVHILYSQQQDAKEFWQTLIAAQVIPGFPSR